MYLIEEETEEIRKYLLKKSNKEKNNKFWDNEIGNQQSAWKNYGQCKHMKQEIISYDFDSPIELIRYLEELWDTDKLFDVEFIRLLTVIIFRKKQLIEEKEETKELIIPDYIYNF